MQYRKGAVGAMMDEYERAVREMMTVYAGIDQSAYELLRDASTQDENCRSFQTIMSHVISAGYGYADSFRGAFGMTSSRPPKLQLPFSEVPAQMKKMLDYTIDTLQDKWEMSEGEILAIRIKS